MSSPSERGSPSMIDGTKACHPLGLRCHGTRTAVIDKDDCYRPHQINNSGTQIQNHVSVPRTKMQAHDAGTVVLVSF